MDLDLTIKTTKIEARGHKMRLPCLFTHPYKGIPITVVIREIVIEPTIYAFHNLDAELELNDYLTNGDI